MKQPTHPHPIPAHPKLESPAAAMPPWRQGTSPPARARWIKRATLVQLLNEHAAANRDLNLPGAEIMKAEYAAIEADLAALWAEIQGRRVGAARKVAA